jgi:hypothetical protein
MRFRPLPAGLALLLWWGCTRIEDDRARVDLHLDAAQWTQAEVALRQGLDRHPDDVPLLLTGARLYLRTDVPDFYRPRLALHYAMRADRAARGGNAEVAKVLFAAWRANGRPDELDALVQKGLEQVRHPDARAPRELTAVDPDLLEPTLGNLAEEQRRRRGERTEPCHDLVAVPGGTWPLPAGPRAVPAFCLDPQEHHGGCEAAQLRACSPQEIAVVCGPLATTLRRDDLCAPAAQPPCCRDPLPQVVPFH